MTWYTPVLFGLNLISTINFVLLPAAAVLLLFFLKRNLLWAAPILSTALMTAVDVIAVGPSLLTEGEYRGMFLIGLVPLHLAVTILLTALAYGAAYLLRRKDRRTCRGPFSAAGSVVLSASADSFGPNCPLSSCLFPTFRL